MVERGREGVREGKKKNSDLTILRMSQNATTHISVGAGLVHHIDCDSDSPAPCSAWPGGTPVTRM